MFLNVNDAAVTFYGYSVQEFLSLNLNDLNSPKKQTDDKRYCVHTRKDGDIAYVNVESKLLMIEGICVKLMMMFDITEKIKSEMILPANEVRFRYLVEEGINLMAILNADLKYTYACESCFKENSWDFA